MTNKRFLILSNIFLEPYFSEKMRKMFSDEKIEIEFESLDDKKYISSNAEVRYTYIIFIINLTELLSELFLSMEKNSEKGEIIKKYCEEIYYFVKRNAVGKIIWFGFENYDIYQDGILGCIPHDGFWIDKINIHIFNFLDENDIFIDLKKIISWVGVEESYSRKGKYRWNAPYSEKIIEKICFEIYKQNLIDLERTPKCLVLDCDNVLWGGELAELGLEGIILGEYGKGHEYQDFQRFLCFLYEHGIILAICSKNDLEEVKNVFMNHSGMILKEENISMFSVNWNNKVDNIVYISQVLNIGLESMVFVDDEKFEVGIVQERLPMIKTIQFDLESIYSKLGCFSLKQYIDSSIVEKRTRTYRTDGKRAELKRCCCSEEDYIKNLCVEANISVANQSEFSRISELSLRVNKCTNGIRLSRVDIEQQCYGDRLYSVYVRDKFSDLGLVGYIGISEKILTAFGLSCRALGRNIEQIMIEYAVKEGCTEFSFLSTGKNQKLEKLLKKSFP